MKTVAVVLLIFCFGLSTVENTKCYECRQSNAQSCEGKEVDCPKGSSCMTISTKTGLNHTYYAIQKRCSMNMKCNHSMYAYASGDVYFDLSIDCCEGDLCNSGGVIIKNTTYDYNGPECPVCSSVDSLDICEAVSTTVCRNKTDYCNYFTGHLERPDGVKTQFTARGCMSETSCSYDFSQIVGLKVSDVKAGCKGYKHNPKPNPEPEN
ncbi:phospholipase A2 inhibitor and Ly6/PLAUR domain-containing protein-like [Rana temporaria]|uniref:phospholipase A2 inhibitor and Ly6/PLAUR domain-containing protein-like n=1 Tax=Rana temporaria TaxID=8407 RepID=UPI001AACDFBE|nr:phospholipase A2 inhibitor and Ly6/PLAUR domain-containing protein-like [Rana temporaria]